MPFHLHLFICLSLVVELCIVLFVLCRVKLLQGLSVGIKFGLLILVALAAAQGHNWQAVANQWKIYDSGRVV